MSDFIKHITPGPWGRIKDDDISISGEGWMDAADRSPTTVNGWVILGSPDDDSIAIAVIDLGPTNQWDDGKADAHEALVVEAITVAHETSLSPRQLLNQRDALIEAGTALMEMLDPWEFISPNPEMRDAIRKMRGALHWAEPLRAFAASRETEISLTQSHEATKEDGGKA